MSKRYRLVIFDWDGTLMDSSEYIAHCVQAAAKDLDLPVPPVTRVKEGIGLGYEAHLRQLFPEHMDTLDIQHFNTRYQYHFHQADPFTLPTLFPGAEGMLRELKERGYLLAVATGMQSHNLETILAKLQLQSRFDVTRCADQTCSKPHPQMLKEILSVLSISAHDALMVGDTVFDMCMAKNAGVDRLAVSYGTHPVEKLQAYHPVCVVDTVQDVLLFLEEGLEA